jgi:nicotinamide N-methyltransferase
MLWNAGQVMSDYLQDNANRLVQGKAVLELGAGAGLPGLVCAVGGARKVYDNGFQLRHRLLLTLSRLLLRTTLMRT